MGVGEGTDGGDRGRVGALNESVFIRRRENLSFALALEVLVFKFPYNLNTELVYITQVSLQFTKVPELSFCDCYKIFPTISKPANEKFPRAPASNILSFFFRFLMMIS